MTTSPQSQVPPGRPYVDPGRGYVPAADRQPVRITGTVRTKPGIWRIAWGVCLGLFLFALISTAIGIAVVVLLVALGYNPADDITLNTLSAGASTLAHA